MSPHGTALKGPTAHRRVRVAHDADDHAQNLSRWSQSYNQFSAGRFEGRLTELWLPQLQVFVESANQALHQFCAAWPDAYWFGIPVPHRGVSRIDAQPIPDNTLLFRPGGTQFELHTPEHYSIYGIVLCTDFLRRHLVEVEGLDPDHTLGSGALTLAPRRYQRLIDHVAALLREPVPARRDARVRVEQIQDAILTELGMALASGSSPDPQARQSRVRHSQQIVNRARDLVLSCPDRRLSIADLCRQLHISRRALQYCFQEVVGLSPLAYLRTLRLNEVRRGLHASRAPTGCVTQIATTWGFEHLGQFSTDYRKLFGEPPSAALRQARRSA